MAYPPSKRPRGFNQERDSFGDDADFTQDDLEEIDIIASQAIVRDAQPTGSKRTLGGAPVREGRKTFALGNSGSLGGGPDRDELDHGRLEAELRRKLKEAEEQILMKSGEIRVLRDSLVRANREREQERQAHLHLETNKAHAQSEKERELVRKVESLQSELHFKEAEMNEMRSKLQSSERGARLAGSTNSPAGRALVTKQAFSSELPVRPSFTKETSGGGNGAQVGSGDPGRRTEGPALLNLLLQQRLDPSSLGLCHLLCVGSDALLAGFPRPGFSSSTSTAGPGASSADIGPLPRPPSDFHRHQSLAMSALSALAHSAPARSCPAAAVRLLPLLQYHVCLYCRALETAGEGPLPGASGRRAASSPADALGAREELALAAVSALYHVVSQSDEAAGRVLSEGPAAQDPLLGRLAQLADPGFVGNARRRERVLNSSLRTLCVLAERAGEGRLLRLQTVLTTPAVVQNLSPDSACSTVFLCVRFLALMVDSEDVASKLCSHKYVCPFVWLFQYVTARSDTTVTDETWSRLELQTVRLLTKLFGCRTSTWVALGDEATCQCSSQVVKTVVMVLHRRWLSIKARERDVRRGRTWAGPGVQSLRETLMLLHWLHANDPCFSAHCLDVLHMFHQIIPAVGDTLRRIPDLSESEELAIDDMCRPGAEDVEDMDIDAAS